MQSAKNSRQGFLLLETLVVIGVIGVLLGLLLPAIQMVRVSVTRVNCQNRLKQISLAALQYEQLHRALPPGVNSDVNDPFRNLTWMVYLLPFIEQEVAWQKAVADAKEIPITHLAPPHSGLRTLIDTYTCPADGRLSTLHRVTSTYMSGTLIAPGSYLGVSGTGATSPRNNAGVFFSNSKTRMSDIIDGTSFTLMVGERPPSADFAYGWWYTISNGNQGAGILPIPNDPWGMDGDNPGFNCPKVSYPFRIGKLDEICDTLHFWSFHSGGANFAFCDGSVRFIPYSASDKLPGLATKAGNEPISSLD